MFANSLALLSAYNVNCLLSQFCVYLVHILINLAALGIINVCFSYADIGGRVYGPTTAADLSTLFDVGGILGNIN